MQLRIRAYGSWIEGKTGERLQRVTAWSAWAEVECALLNRQDWTAIPISRSILGPPGNNPLRPFAFRKSIDLLSNFGPILQARLYATALRPYRAYLNGKRVGDREMDPGWTSYSHHLAYQLFDVSSEIAAQNVLALEVAEGWCAGRLGFDGGKRYL